MAHLHRFPRGRRRAQTTKGGGAIAIPAKPAPLLFHLLTCEDHAGQCKVESFKSLFTMAAMLLKPALTKGSEAIAK